MSETRNSQKNIIKNSLDKAFLFIIFLNINFEAEMCYKAHKIVSENKIIMFIFLFILFSHTNILHAATYSIPEIALSIYVEDIDHDKDLDIVVGHGYNATTDWKGITTLVNANSDFQNINSEYNEVGSRTILLEKFNKNDDFDIITQGEGGIKIFYDYITDSVTVFHQVTDKYPDDIKTGDIDGDGDIDIVFYSNSGYFWGYMKNDGSGQFSSPVYYELDFTPTAISCGDIDNDGMTDIAVGSGGRLSIFYIDDIWGMISEDIETTINIYGLSVFDINNDNKNELIIVDGALFGSLVNIRFTSIDSDWNMNEYYRKNIDESLISFNIADLNDDSFSDIVYNAYSSDSTYVLYNENGVSFADPVNYQTYFGDTSNYTSTIKSFVADIDGNTLKDIVALNSSYAYENDVTILFQTEEGDFVQDPQTGIEDQDNLASTIKLYQNYPNPFNNETKIQFSLDASSEVELNIHNGKGELVENLVKGRYDRGAHSASYRTDGLTSGVYYYELKVNGIMRQVKKMLYLR